MKISIKTVTELSFDLELEDNKGNRLSSNNMQLHKNDYDDLVKLVERIIKRTQNTLEEKVRTKEEKVALSIATGYDFGVLVEDCVNFGNTYNLERSEPYIWDDFVWWTTSFNEMKPIAKEFLEKRGIDPTKELATFLMENNVKK